MINDSSFNARGEVKNILFLLSPDPNKNKGMAKISREQEVNNKDVISPLAI